jgi:hypothetical protein
MHKQLVAGIGIACALWFAAAVRAQDQPNMLVGKWHSDKALTMKYVKANVRTDDQSLQFMQDIAGHLTYTFTADHMITDRSAFDLHYQGKVVHIKELHDERQYRVVGSNSTQSLISVNTEEGMTSITFNFDNKDAMWFVWSGDAIGISMPESREYFTRAK